MENKIVKSCSLCCECGYFKQQPTYLQGVMFEKYELCICQCDCLSLTNH